MTKLTKIILFLLVIISTAHAGSGLLSPHEQNQLKRLGCKTIGYHFTDGYLIIGDKTIKQGNGIFLVKNISKNTVIIDYPPAHIGASAGLTQCLNQTQWAGYHYTKNNDILRTDRGKQKPIWKCNAQTAKTYQSLDRSDKSYCNRLLYICLITKNKANGDSLQKSAAALLQQQGYVWFTASRSDSACYAVNSLQKVLQ